MNFANPNALWGLLALVIPVAVHLFSFRFTRRIFFSNVSLLREIKEESRSRRIVRERLLLMSRLLAITAMVLAFAQPQWGTKASAVSGSRHHAIFIDNSPSMTLMGSEGMLLEQAREGARAIALAAKPDEKFQLLTHDLAPSSQRWLTRDAFLQALEEIQPTGRSQPAAVLMQRQLDLIQSTAATSAQIYWLSDLQQGTSGLEGLNVPSGLGFQLLQLTPSEVANLYVDSVWLEQPVLRKGERARILFRVANGGAADASRVRIQLFVEGVQKGLATVDLPANGNLTDTIDFTPDQSGNLRAVLQLDDRVFPYDDSWYLQLPVKDSLSLLYIRPAQPSPYIRALFKNDEFVRLDELPRLGLDYNQLNKFSAFVIEGGDATSSGMYEALLKEVEAGASLIYLPAATDEIKDVQAVLTGLQMGRISSLEKGSWEVRRLEVQDRLFQETFSRLPEQLALPGVKQYFRYQPDAKERALMQLNNDDVWLARHEHGAGNVTVLLSALSPEWSDFTRHALLVPVFFRAVQLGGDLLRSSYRLNQADAIMLRAGDVPAAAMLSMEKQGEKYIPEVRRAGGRVMLNAVSGQLSPGHYQLFAGDQPLPGLNIALNANAEESRFNYIATEDLKELAALQGWETISLKQADLAGKLIAQAGTASHWKWLLLAVLVFLLLETLILKFIR